MVNAEIGCSIRSCLPFSCIWFRVKLATLLSYHTHAHTHTLRLFFPPLYYLQTDVRSKAPTLTSCVSLWNIGAWVGSGRAGLGRFILSAPDWTWMKADVYWSVRSALCLIRMLEAHAAAFGPRTTKCTFLVFFKRTDVMIGVSNCRLANFQPWFYDQCEPICFIYQ